MCIRDRPKQYLSGRDQLYREIAKQQQIAAAANAALLAQNPEETH